jgi:PAS domain-containing protein
MAVGAAQLIELFAYAISTLLIAALGGAMHRARRRSEGSEQRFRAFMQNSPNGVFLKDEDGRYLFMNRTGEGLASRTDWLGKTDEELFGGRVAREIRDHDHAAADRAYWLGRDGDVQRARDAGFDAHVTKPVDPGTLNEMICRASA